MKRWPLLLFAALLAAMPASAATLHVRAEASGANDGTTWADAFTRLQEALAAAVPGDEIWVAAGIYTPGDGPDPQATFTLRDGVTVYGGFLGHESESYDRDWLANETVLSGNPGVEPGAQTVSEFVVTAVQLDSTAVLDGFRIRQGRHGLLVDGGNPVVRLCFITDNRTWGGGDGAGALVQNGARPLFQWDVFTDNHALEGSGGGIAAFDSHPRLVGCDIYDNTAAISGGGMRGSGDFLQVQIRLNHADQDAGGLDGSGRLEDVLFHANSSLLGTGGMVGRGELTDVIFLLNQGDTVASCTGGGGALRGGGTLTNVSFIGNTHSCLGGGMYDPTGVSTLVNALFLQNRAELHGGGGLWLGPPDVIVRAVPVASARIVNSSFSGNVAVGGGAVYVSFVELAVSNSIFWSDNADFGAEFNGDGGTILVDHSIVDGSAAGTFWTQGFITDRGGNLDVDPLFESSGNLRLTARSPAIDAGDDDAIPPGVTTDIEGNERILRAHVDLGAFEYTGPLAIDPPAGPPALARYLRNTPNPFNPATLIEFGIDEPGFVELTIFDVAGRHVKTLHRGPIPAGGHGIQWDGSDDAGSRVASGVYLCRLRTDAYVLARRLLLVK